MITVDFLDRWRFVRGETAREMDDREYRIVDGAMRTNDPKTILASIDAVGNPPSLRMIRHQAQTAVDIQRRKEKKANPSVKKPKDSWWSRFRSPVSKQPAPRQVVTGIKDKLFFRKLWAAVEPYLAADLDASRRKDLAAAFYTGRADVVLQALQQLPPTSEIKVVADEIGSLYPSAFD
jgi:hypothetical protein